MTVAFPFSIQEEKMANVKWIKIVTDIFDDEKMLLIDGMPDRDGIIVIWFKLLSMAKLKNRQGVQVWRISENKQIEITDDALVTIFRRDNAPQMFKVLEEHGFIKRHKCYIEIIPFWQDRHDRSSARYRDWRESVFERDGYICQGCGTKKNLQAHHIEPWEKCTGDKAELRYSVENGITLCRACHLEAHGGSWRG